jgi:glycosyltransferase involved in cell wall biosynthesis
VIPAWRAEAHLGACLDALAHQSAPSESFEVIVVDDASPDRTAQTAEAAGVRVLRHDTNRGAAAARNTGAAAARGGILLFVDSDVIPSPGLVEGTAAALDGPTQAATGRYDAEPANDTRFARYKALWTFWCWERSGAATGTSSHLQGALAAVRKDLFDEVGGFDESFEGGSVEDYELSARLRAAGCTIAFDDRIRGRHHFPGFRTAARNYWDRTRSWARLAPELKSFSSGQANPRSAAAALFALGGVVGTITLPWGLPLAAVGAVGYLAAAGPFLKFVAHRDGPAFAAYAATVHYALSAVIGAAALTTPFGSASRRDRTEP